jgi:hypothetical protein
VSRVAALHQPPDHSTCRGCGGLTRVLRTVDRQPLIASCNRDIRGARRDDTACAPRLDHPWKAGLATTLHNFYTIPVSASGLHFSAVSTAHSRCMRTSSSISCRTRSLVLASAAAKPSLNEGTSSHR